MRSSRLEDRIILVKIVNLKLNNDVQHMGLSLQSDIEKSIFNLLNSKLYEKYGPKILSSLSKKQKLSRRTNENPSNSLPTASSPPSPTSSSAPLTDCSDCPICMENMSSSDNYTLEACGHEFHAAVLSISRSL
jgi:hypothetical protein